MGREMGIPFGIRFNEKFYCTLHHLGTEISPKTLSTGEKKKVDFVIIMALMKMIKVRFPSLNILFLDEIFSLATVINGLALQEMLERLGVPTRVQTAIEMSEIAEPYIRRRAIRHLEKNRVVIFAGGTGNPFFTTDTAAALRAAEIDAEVLLKGTHSGIDGIYTADPKVDPTATKLDTVSYLDVLSNDLRAMDATATTLCMDNNLPIVLFDLMGEDNVPKILAGEAVGTIVS